MPKVSLFQNRVPQRMRHRRNQGRYSRLEPDEGKLSRPVLRRGDGSNPGSLAGSPQEVVAWLRDDTVHHLKRGKALRGTLTLTSLVYEVSPSSLKADTSAARKDQGPPAAGMATVTEVNLFYPLCKDWGAAKRGRGKERNTPPPSSPVSL